jgi:serine/threonine protein kinase/DNA-directed RNA polymerase subunit RPC12/RpoP
MNAYAKGDLLLGRIALREGLITREQLYDCLTAQERNPARRLGQIMVTRGYLKQVDVDRLLEIQKRALGETPAARGAMLGRILIDRGLATEFQVNECLRLQGRLLDLGITPLPRLGEILVKRGYIKRDAVETALQFQNLLLYACPECGARIDVGAGDAAAGDYTCAACGAEVPFLFAKMAASVHEALESTSRELDLDLPGEVAAAAGNPANHFGRYILVREIGRGGAGIVYRAWQKEINRVVALKLLPHESDTASGVKTPYGDAEDVKRIYNETRALAELIHPNIVPILDFGLVDNHFYFTMKYVDGATLDRLLRNGLATHTTRLVARGEPSPAARVPEPRALVERRLTMGLVAAIMRDICRAVHFAHERGVFHRDIKPSNIIIERADGRPHIMDFGLAKLRHLGDSAYVMGVVMGTPQYMPPEQASGDMESVDNLSDIYSLGAVLYELVSGLCPYAGRSPDEVLERLAVEPPDPLELVAAGAPDELRQIVRRAMRREKADRYPTAAEMADDLQRYLDGAPRPAGKDETKSLSIWERFKQILS